MAETFEPMTIGTFSALTRLSVRMLRHYHERGVLVPAFVDGTGYRRYTRDQIADALLVRDLRDVGFGVSAMAALLAARDTPSFQRALLTQRDVLEQEKRAATQRLRSIDRMLQNARGSAMSTNQITLRTMPAMTVAAYRGTVPTYADEGQLWQQFMPELQRQGLTPTGPGGVFEHDPTYVDEDPDLSVFLPVPPGTTAEGPLEVIDVPEQRAVVARVVGPFSQVSLAHDRITAFLTDNGLSEAPVEVHGLTGKVFNIYLSDPSTVDESAYLTDVHRPVQ
ncbi:MAG TPA: MerR family transcriptional regulator [Beutenbergiaceae bacterium]|nr:MerR family transcriptional regulator [Beutenbergiaceae bacterium]